FPGRIDRFISIFPLPSLVTRVLIIPGSCALSAFRRARLLQAFAARGLPVASVEASHRYFVGADEPLDADARQRLEALLDDGRPREAATADRHALELLVVPRPGTVSPWASKATDIARHCGVSGVRRIERGIRYVLTPERGLLGKRDFDADQRAAIAACLHDRMTEAVVGGDFDGQALFTPLTGAPVQAIPVGTRGREALEDCNRAMGLALSDDEIDYLLRAYTDLR